MPQISRFFGISIYMYAKDHYPPHFHALYGDQEAMIDIENSIIIAGELSSRAYKLVKEWNEDHKQELLHNFAESQKPNPKFQTIAPLK